MADTLTAEPRTETGDKTVTLPRLSRARVAIAQATYARRHLITWILGLWKSFEKRMKQEGFGVEPGRLLFGEAMARIDAALPMHVCQLCGDKRETDPNCLCKGRGYFDKTQVVEYSMATARAQRGGLRAVDVIAGKRPRLLQRRKLTVDDMAEQMLKAQAESLLLEGGGDE